MEQVEELTFLLQWFCTFLVGDLYTAKHIVVMSITSPPAGWRGGALILEINVKGTSESTNIWPNLPPAAGSMIQSLGLRLVLAIAEYIVKPARIGLSPHHKEETWLASVRAYHIREALQGQTSSPQESP